MVFLLSGIAIPKGQGSAVEGRSRHRRQLHVPLGLHKVAKGGPRRSRQDVVAYAGVCCEVVDHGDEAAPLAGSGDQSEAGGRGIWYPVT